MDMQTAMQTEQCLDMKYGTMHGKEVVYNIRPDDYDT